MILLEACLILYVILIAFFCYGFLILPTYTISEQNIDNKPSTGFTIVIPFRNEAENLERLLNSLFALDYPKSLYEILLINDDSSDQSLQVIQKFIECHSLNLKVVNSARFSGSPKKDALTKGISLSSFDWIVTTDADCSVPKNWLHAIDFKAKQPLINFIAGPVTLFSQQGFLNVFQQLDFLSLQGATIGSFGLNKPFMCNGANLAFSKNEFLKLNGYQNTNHIASGDDLFLLQKFADSSVESVVYMKSKDALVYSNAQTTFSQLSQQRKRWASKASAYTSVFALGTSLLVLTGNIASIASLFFLKDIGYIVLIKLFIDFCLIYLTARLFKQTEPLKYYFVVLFLHPFFTVYIAVWSQFGEFEWKGRSFKK
ncbi:glycosyltransferase [Leeuwenhoekiella aequorea]|uniref:glycosyltransferase family 2 protein n=1 Tax=Leeuwenhoekiella aequorea TaxID=283736 RepID=UPI00352FC099